MAAPTAEPPTEELPALPGPDQSPPPVAGARFDELAAAVRDHEHAAGARAVPKRPTDHALYRLLNELEAGAASPGDQPPQA